MYQFLLIKRNTIFTSSVYVCYSIAVAPLLSSIPLLSSTSVAPLLSSIPLLSIPSIIITQLNALSISIALSVSFFLIFSICCCCFLIVSPICFIFSSNAFITFFVSSRASILKINCECWSLSGVAYL